MGRIDRPTRPELPESTDWMRLAKISGLVLGGGLLLWFAYLQAQGPDAVRVVKTSRPRERIVFVHEPEQRSAPVTAAPTPSAVVPEEKPATAEIVPEHSSATAAPPTEPPPAPPATVTAITALRERIAGCVKYEAGGHVRKVTLSGRSQTAVTVRVENFCDENFPGSEVWLDLVARRGRAAGVSAKERVHFQGTVQAKTSHSEEFVLECDPSYSYEFEATPVREWFESPTR